MTLHGKEGTTQIVELEGGGCVIAFLSNDRNGNTFLSLKDDFFEANIEPGEEAREACAYFTPDELLDLAAAAFQLYEDSLRQQYHGVLSTYGLGRAALDYRQRIGGATK